MPRLAGRVAFITGAGNGIGCATAILFAREGARVAIAEIDARAGDETAHLAGNETIAIRATTMPAALLHRTTPRSTRRSMNFGGRSSSIFTARFSGAASAFPN